MSVDVNKKASDFLSESKSTFYSFKKNWSSFATEMPQKVNSLARSGLTYSVTNNAPSSYSDSGLRPITIGVNFKMNTEPLEEYLKVVKEKLKEYEEKLTDIVKNIDSQLTIFVDDGIDGNLFKDFVSHINDCANYFSEMILKYSGSEKSFEKKIETPEVVTSIQNKWKKASDVEIRKNEAKKYGVSLEMLDKHKKYLAAVDKKKTGTTSAEIRDAKKTLLSLGDYLDSADLASDCDETIEKLLAIEAEERRIAKEKARIEQKEKERKEREAKAKEEEKQKLYLSNLEQAKKECEEAKEAFSSALDEALKEKTQKLEKEKDSKLESLRQNKLDAENRLASLGFFKFGEKRDTRNEIERLENEIQVVGAPSYLNKDIENMKNKAKNAKSRYTYELSKYLEARFPYDPDRKVEKKEIINNEYKAGSDEAYMMQILKSMSFGLKYSCVEIRGVAGDPISDYEKISASKLSLLLTILVNTHQCLYRDIINSVPHFSINDNGVSVLNNRRWLNKEVAEPFKFKPEYNENNKATFPVAPSADFALR